MPERATTEKAKSKLRHGRSASTAAGEFVREEMHHIREGKHGARSAKQAIAIGLSKARRAGIPLGTPKRGSAASKRRVARSAASARRNRGHAPSRTRSRAVSRALRREPHAAASHTALSRHAHETARVRGRADRSAAARKASRTKGPSLRRAAARKAARTRRRK